LRILHSIAGIGMNPSLLRPSMAGGPNCKAPNLSKGPNESFQPFQCAEL
jgi:hypothetical protein